MSKGANSVGENVSLGIFGRKGDFVNFLGVDKMVLTSENIHRFVDLLLCFEAALVFVEGDISLDDGLSDSFCFSGGFAVIYCVSI